MPKPLELEMKNGIVNVKNAIISMNTESKMYIQQLETFIQVADNKAGEIFLKTLDFIILNHYNMS